MLPRSAGGAGQAGGAGLGRAEYLVAGFGRVASLNFAHRLGLMRGESLAGCDKARKARMEVVIRFGLLAWLVWQWKSQGKGKMRVWHVLKGKRAGGFSRVAIEQQVAGENRMADKACVLELSWEKYICGAVREIKETMRTVSPANISFANRYGTGSLGAPSRRPGVRVTLCEIEQRGLGRHNALSHPNFECEQFIEAPAPPPAQVIHFKFSVTFCVSNGPTHLRLLPQACAKKKKKKKFLPP